MPLPAVSTVTGQSDGVSVPSPSWALAETRATPSRWATSPATLLSAVESLPSPPSVFFPKDLTAKGGQRPWQWFSTDRRESVERIRPAEESWVESRPSRERVAGWFLGNTDDYRLHAVIDGPSRAVPDRVLQRTGPCPSRRSSGAPPPGR